MVDITKITKVMKVVTYISIVICIAVLFSSKFSSDAVVKVQEFLMVLLLVSVVVLRKTGRNIVTLGFEVSRSFAPVLPWMNLLLLIVVVRVLTCERGESTSDLVPATVFVVVMFVWSFIGLLYNILGGGNGDKVSKK